MEQDVETSYRPVCSTCLSTDRNLYAITGMPQVYQMFRLLMYDFAGERLEDADIEQYLCWECLALMRRLVRFKLQAQSAQEHLRVLALSGTNEGLDHTYLSQTLSTLETQHKVDYDRIYFDYTTNEEWAPQYISITPRSVKDEQYDVGQVVAEDISFQIENHVLEVPTATLDGTVAGSLISHIVVGPDGVVSTEDLHVKGEMPELIVSPILTHRAKDTTILISQEDAPKMSEFKKENDVKCGYNVDLMTEEELQASREAAKEQVHYASSVYKCELCIVGFYTHQQVEDHFVSLHKQKLGTTACKICCVYIEDAKLSDHIASHYTRYTCKHCGHVETSSKLIALHVNRHIVKQKVPNNVVHIGDATASVTKGRKKKAKKETPKTPPKPGDLRKLLSKTTVELYKCLECEMFFKTSRARKNHVARVHREGLQCDRCKKRFVNRTTLATHLRLHEGPLPREECPICHKMVRVIQLKYHIQRHQNKSRYPCTDCNKVFSHLATYQAHLKYSRAHATEQIFKFPCPMCNKGYPTKEAMQDHFNYQHLGKTSHKCPVCDKPIASRANVEKHMMRVHGEKKQKPRNYVCQQCGKSFTDKKALTQHIVIHSSDRPLVCDICRQTFKQKASLYTHRKRVHKIMPVRRELHYMNDQNSAGSE